MELFRQKGKIIFFILISLITLYATYLYLTVGQRGFDDGLVRLSEQFLKGRMDLPVLNSPSRDVSSYNNNFYLYFGPLSSIILMPFALIFGSTFPQVSIGVLSMVVSFIAVYGIAKHFKFSSIDRLWLSLFFVFSTVLFSSSVINITAYQVEALGVPFILFAILLYLKKRNGLLIGICIALAILTRFTLVLSVVFFFVELLQKRMAFRQFTLLLIPVIVALGLLGAYNKQRFNSVFETGYNYSTTKADHPIGKNLKYNDKNLRHIPANLYSFLIMAPEPLLKDKDGAFFLRFPYLKANPWGIAIWFTSPLFVYLLVHFKKGVHTSSAGVATILLALPVFVWYSIGYAQFGYRYALDFLPFLFLLLIYSLTPKLSKTAIALILLGVIFNCIYIDSIWETYPIFNMYTK